MAGANDQLDILIKSTPVMNSSPAQNLVDEERLLAELSKVKDIKSTLETILEHAYDGIMVVNSEGIITTVNKAYCRFLGFEEVELLGKPVKKVIENTRLHIVLETGQAEVGELQRIGNHDFIAMRIPIFKEGKVVGAVGKIMFKNIHELNALAQKINKLDQELAYYKDELQKFRGAKYTLDALVGQSYSITMLKETVRRVAIATTPVLIRGESGTGKRLLAHAIHFESQRKQGPFIQVHCGTAAPQELEKELFGEFQGRDDDPSANIQGKVKLAHRGTLLIDEIGDMPLSMQYQLLQLLQGQGFQIDEEGHKKPLDLRLIATTNRNLEDLVRKGLFREDLYFRLTVVSLFIPPLRDHLEDIPQLVQHFVEKYNKERGMGIRAVAEEALTVLTSYSWPGNVKELTAVIERAYDFLEGDRIELKDLPVYLQKLAGHDHRIQSKEPQSLQSLLEQTEINAIRRALLKTKGNKVQAAQILGISRAGLYQKLMKYNILE
ncbi:sigma-54 interaction domain-containing protein [Heliorestis convoluta]|uniref:Sigma-54 dependent transcriptional regulator n=1 Tax=Heliorestis convoluta TaxID=356322 RepID=A0A5Q2MZP0_9FIRM|nr:sigma 54-interacting transcriptional regulator [Heliorestis convoluta]QGG46949.1 Sigma-54 dependent transcriptional regulator [Heliorestis convoluta]